MSPVSLSKMFIVNRTFVVHFFYFCVRFFKRDMISHRNSGCFGGFICTDKYNLNVCEALRYTGKSVEDILYEEQRKIILKIAEEESCVIIGRNADFILKDRDDVLNVFIHGNMPEKIQRISRLYNVSDQEAAKLIADTDKRRMTNYNFYTEQKWGKASNYTLCLNSSQLGYDRCEAVIMECAK